jgi:hypothetical protein
MVIDPTPVFRVMFAPAARTIVPVLVATPVPNAETTFALLDAEIVILDAPLANAMFAPATRDTLLELAFKLKLVAAIATGEEIVIVPPEAPTDTAPAPDRLKLFPMEIVVEAAPSVFPAIVPVRVEWAAKVLEIVIVLRLLDKPIPAPATRDTLLDDPLSEKFVAKGTVGPTIVIEDAPVVSVILLPATNVTLLLVPFSEKLVANGTVGPTTVIDDAPELNVIFAPATKLTLDDEAFNEKLVATGTDGPTTVIDEAPLLNVMFAPATKLTLLLDAFRLKLVAIGTVGPTRVKEDAPELIVKFAPATKLTLDELPLSENPAPPPPAPPIIVIVEFDCESVILVPATRLTLLVLPFRLKLAANASALANGVSFNCGSAFTAKACISTELDIGSLLNRKGMVLESPGSAHPVARRRHVARDIRHLGCQCDLRALHDSV